MNRWIWMTMFVVTAAAAVVLFRSKKTDLSKEQTVIEESQAVGETPQPFSAPPSTHDLADEAPPLKPASGPLGLDPVTPAPPSQDNRPTVGKSSPPMMEPPSPSQLQEPTQAPSYVPPPAQADDMAPPPASPPTSLSEGDPFSAPPQPGTPLPPPAQAEQEYNNFNNNGNYNNNGYGNPGESAGAPPMVDSGMPPPVGGGGGFEDGGYEAAPPQPAPVPMPDED